MWCLFVFMVLLFPGCALKGVYNKSEGSCNVQLLYFKGFEGECGGVDFVGIVDN